MPQFGKTMSDISKQTRELIDKIEHLLMQMPAEAVRMSPNQGGWSSKEIIGHLIDSAVNNHHRFVCGVQTFLQKVCWGMDEAASTRII